MTGNQSSKVVLSWFALGTSPLFLGLVYTCLVFPCTNLVFPSSLLHSNNEQLSEVRFFEVMVCISFPDYG